MTARATKIQTALRTPQLEATPAVTSAYAVVVRTLVRVVGELNAQITALEAELTTAFEQHADAEIVASLPGLGPILGARALAEFGVRQSTERKCPSEIVVGSLLDQGVLVIELSGVT